MPGVWTHGYVGHGSPRSCRPNHNGMIRMANPGQSGLTWKLRLSSAGRPWGPFDGSGRGGPGLRPIPPRSHGTQQPALREGSVRGG
jgi:hypothetical protein